MITIIEMLLFAYEMEIIFDKWIIILTKELQTPWIERKKDQVLMGIRETIVFLT